MEEKMKNKISTPRYQQIAIEIATRIASEEYRIGEKIYARSNIAGQYGVSPETARRAISVLCDLNIVSSEKGSGVTIKSHKNAVNFIKQHSKRKTIDTIKENILDSIDRQQKEMDTLNRHLSDLIIASEHFRSMNPFMPFEVRITSKCIYLNKTISEIQFWQNTGATVLAIQRNDMMIKSPGPYAILLENDILYFLSQDDNSKQVKDFLYPLTEE
ncbi:GntR family transcriptional regulator [Clostridium sp. NSJ-6]|uniref:GntR family transcriptional regulator n=2 Tax=Clostridium hominis TaxID=2763036 RepID=A0ABR7DCV0_9CLOT|nr:TrkA C-terminal domain-containing protein [Clostridium hominis]MBC5629220.1 GntR family transcriptional regulator [Clostridium hominis]MDU2671722.1 TrkA C-terminal domain-containing protein [Clostridium sp.]